MTDQGDFTLGQPTARAEKKRDRRRDMNQATIIYMDALRQKVENENTAKMLTQANALLEQRKMALDNVALAGVGRALMASPPAASGIPSMANYTDQAPAYDPMQGMQPQQGEQGMPMDISQYMQQQQPQQGY